MLKTRLTVAATLALALTGCGDGGPKGTTDSDSKGTSGSSAHFEGAAYPPGVIAPGFTLTNQLGRSVSLSAFHGQVVVLTFLSSTHCRACVLAAQQVRGALDELAGKPTYGIGTALPAMQVLFVTTNPRLDTPRSVRDFLSETSLTDRVSYLTGTDAQLRAVWRTYHVLPQKAGKARSEAATTVLLIGRDGAERDAFGLEQLTPESLSHDIRLLRDG